MPSVFHTHLPIQLEIRTIREETEIPSVTGHYLLVLFGGEIERYMTFTPEGPTWCTGNGRAPLGLYWNKAEAYAVLPKDWSPVYQSEGGSAVGYVTRDELKGYQEAVNWHLDQYVREMKGTIDRLNKVLAEFDERLDAVEQRTQR